MRAGISWARGLINSTAPSGRSRALPLQADFGFEAREIAEDRGHRKRASGPTHAQQAVLARDIAFDGEFVPLLGVAHIVDGHVVVLAPEEGNRFERLAAAPPVVWRRLV